MGEVGERWNSLDAVLAEVDSVGKRVATTAHKLLEQGKAGQLAGARSSAEVLRETAALLDQLLDSVRKQLTELHASTTADSLASETEVLLRDRLPDVRVWRARTELVAYPVVTRFERSGESVKATVGSEVVRTQRPDQIAAAVLTARQAEFKADRFVAALHRAFRLSSGGRDTGTADLEQLYQILSTAAPGSPSYSQAEFGTHLQLLHAAHVSEAAPGITFALRVVAASPSARRVVLETGESTNIGTIVFERVGEPQ